MRRRRKQRVSANPKRICDFVNLVIEQKRDRFGTGDRGSLIFDKSKLIFRKLLDLGIEGEIMKQDLKIERERGKKEKECANGFI